MKAVFRFLPNAIIVIASIVLFLLMSSLIFDLTIDYITSWEFWIKTVVLSVVYMAIHWASYDARVKSLLTNKEEVAARKGKEKKIGDVTGSWEWFDYKAIFISTRNKREKIEAYKLKIQNKLTKLTERAPFWQRNLEDLVITEEERKLMKPKKLARKEKRLAWRKRHSRYLKKKKKFESHLNPEWLINNIDRVHIKYNKITEQFVATGGVIKELNIDFNSPRGKYAKENIPSRIQNLFISGALSAFAADLVLGGMDAQAWFDFCIRMVMLMMNLVMGLNYGTKYYGEIHIDNLDNRISITDEFLSWLKSIGGGKRDGENAPGTLR